jgi:hypothetical protein
LNAGEIPASVKVLGEALASVVSELGSALERTEQLSLHGFSFPSVCLPKMITFAPWRTFHQRDWPGTAHPDHRALMACERGCFRCTPFHRRPCIQPTISEIRFIRSLSDQFCVRGEVPEDVDISDDDDWDLEREPT